MKTKIQLGVVLVAAFLALPAQAQQPQIQWDKDYDFSSVKTYTWQYTPETSLEQSSPFMHSRIINAIEHHLSEGGLTEVKSDPDVYVTYHTETKEQVRLQSNSYGYGFGGWHDWGYVGMTGPTSTTTRVVTYDEGTLIVDIWDAESETLIWRGWVTRVFSEKPQQAEKQVVKAIDQMVKRWQRLSKK